MKSKVLVESLAKLEGLNFKSRRHGNIRITAGQILSESKGFTRILKPGENLLRSLIKEYLSQPRTETRVNLREKQLGPSKETPKLTPSTEFSNEEEPEGAPGIPPVSSESSYQDVQQHLQAALEGAKQLQDSKLIRIIGNSLTYLTRQQVNKAVEG